MIESAKGDPGSFLDEGKLVMDTAVRNITNDLCKDLMGGGGAQSQRGSYGASGGSGSISTGVITLDNPSDIVNFELNMVLVSYSVSSLTPTQSTSAALGYVIGVNRGGGIVTVSATSGGSAGTPTNWSTSFPYLAVQGDINFVSNGLATANALKISGLSAWLPSVAPTAGDSFWGVDRSVDSRLFGQIVNGSSESIQEALYDGAAIVAREGGYPDYAFMNFTSFAALEKSLQSQVQYVQVRHDEADVFFNGIRIMGPYGPITVVPDRNVPARTCFLLSLKYWQLRSTNKVPHILTYGMEGLEALRVSNADAVEIRWGYYANLICSAPGWNANISLSS